MMTYRRLLFVMRCVHATLREGRVMAAGAASVALVSLLNKTSRRRNGMQPDYAGFVCEDKFVVGYGLDFDSEYRELPYIGVLKPEVGWCTLNSF